RAEGAATSAGGSQRSASARVRPSGTRRHGEPENRRDASAGEGGPAPVCRGAAGAESGARVRLAASDAGARAAAPGAHLPCGHDAGAVSADPVLLVPLLEPDAAHAGDALRRAGQLRADRAPRPDLPVRDPQHRGHHPQPADAHGRAGAGAGPAAPPGVPGTRRCADVADLAVSDHAHGQRDDVEEHAVESGVRAVRLRPQRGRPSRAGLAGNRPAALRRRHGDVGVDPVHDAGAAGGIAVGVARTHRQRARRRRGAPRSLPFRDPSAPGALRPDRDAPRHDLPGPGVRRDLRRDLRGAGDRHHQPAVLRVPHGVPVLDDRRRVGDRRGDGDPDHVRGDGILPDPESGCGDRVTVKPSWRSAALTLFTYLVALALVAPIAWMVMTGFKTEAQAFQLPPLLAWRPTLENFGYALGVAQFGRFFLNSVIIGLGSTVLACLLGVPAAYSLAFYPTRHTRDVLFWILSTKMLPVVAVIVPLYVLFSRLHLLDTRLGMILLYTMMNLPLVVWMMRSFFAEVPREIIEATQVDGASLAAGFVRVTLPL